ncbi:RNA ligase family protein [Catellatospora sp. NPDC049609]|uniref:ATP-dependent DNA ligase n=1 Tax=Catellatospora sp. NPDC049609 TaxID=3155505 RepID=UPI0034288B84
MSPLVPMRAEPVDQLGAVPHTAVAYEPKLDGYRGLIITDRRGVRLQSRHGKQLGRYFPDLIKVARAALPEGVVIDGELVIWDAAANATSFSLLGRRITAGRGLADEARRRPAHFVAFDLLQVSGQNIMGLPLRRRRQRLERLLANTPLELTLCPQSRDPADAQTWLSDWSAAGIEGVVIKPLDKPYLPGQGGWHKLRARTTSEAVLAGVTGPAGEPRTLLLGRRDGEGRLRYIGRTAPLAGPLRRELAPLLQTAAGHPWPVPLPAAWQGQLGRPEPLAYRPVDALVVEFGADAGRLVRAVRRSAGALGEVVAGQPSEAAHGVARAGDGLGRAGAAAVVGRGPPVVPA